MILHKTQKLVANDKHRFRVVCCGRRWGKTTLAAFEMIGFGAAYDNVRIPYYAPTRDDARDIMWKMLCDLAEPIIVDKNESRLELTIKNKFGKTSLLVLYGWEAVQERRKGVGVKNKFIVLDEVSKYRNFWEGWHEVLRPTLTDLKGEALFISTPNGFNHFYDLSNIEQKDKDYKFFQFTSYDNPFLPVDELNKAKQEMTEDRFAQEYMADFRKTEGLVYKEFNRERHVVDEEGFDGENLTIVKTLCGVDFGFNNPAAIITIKKDSDNVYWITDEWYKTQQTDAQIADYTSALKLNECYPDPESAGGIEELKRRGVNVRDVIKGKDSIRNGITIVSELLKSNRLYINSRCVNLIWEFETYHYPPKKSEHNEEENPVKEDDHALDAIRYALMMDNNEKKESVQTYTYKGKAGFANKYK
ncbi:terminase large subunit [bacterium]|jgi:PBSX family phage terminase large subunit|nr:terminase large subunit [bacterium]